MTDSDILARVRCGIEWLDREIPDWLWRIDVNKVCMSSDGNCMLGQLGGSFIQAIEDFSISNGESEDMAFCIPDYEKDRLKAWGILDREWRYQILRLRGERPQSEPTAG